MKKTLLLLATFTLPTFADPFYQNASSQQAVENPQNFAKNLPEQTACNQLQHTEIGNLPELEGLILVGIVSIDGEFHSLFVDEAEQLIALKQGDWLSGGTRVEQIDFKGVKFLGFGDDCQTPRDFTHKL